MSDQHHTSATPHERGGGDGSDLAHSAADIVGSDGTGATGAGADTPSGELATKFPNPGLLPHAYRRSDVDPRAAKRRELEVATFFAVSSLGTLLFLIGYFAVKLEDLSGPEMLERVALSTKLLGAGLGIALLCIGLGAVHWAKTLMPDDEVIDKRKPLRSSDEDRAEAVAALKEGAGGAGLRRRPLIVASLFGAVAPLLLVPLAALRDLGPLPGAKLTGTYWKPGRRLVTDPQGEPIKAADVPIGGVIHVQPEGVFEAEHSLDERAKATAIVIRLAPDELKEEASRKDWSYNGIVCYSKVCTHVGCPVGLYEQTTKHLLCPCHQSTFDVPNHCKVIFGPAGRPLPQLPLDVDAEGYLVSRDDFQEPIGPSYWERGER